MHTWVRPRAVGELRSLERFWPCCSAPARWGYPLPNGLNTYYFFNPPSAYRIPLADSWNLTVQHELTSTLTAEVAYVGNVGPCRPVRQRRSRPTHAIQMERKHC